MVTKTATMKDVGNLARMHVDFFNRQELEEGAKHVTNDCTWEMVAFDETYRGPKGYIECNRNWATAFPDARVEVLRVVSEGNIAVLELRGRGTHKGSLSGPNGTIKATGKRVDFPICEVYEFANDKLHHLRTYFDSATLMRQLGVTH